MTLVLDIYFMKVLICRFFASVIPFGGTIALNPSLSNTPLEITLFLEIRSLLIANNYPFGKPSIFGQISSFFQNKQVFRIIRFDL